MVFNQTTVSNKGYIGQQLINTNNELKGCLC